MKITKYFAAALALTSIVACSKDDATKAPDNQAKSIAITIENMALESRAGNNGETAPGVAGKVVETSDLNVYFANSAGVIIGDMGKLSDALDQTQYVYHQVTPAVDQVVILRNPKTNVEVGTTTIADLDSPTVAVDSEVSAIPLYGASQITSSGTTCEYDGIEYPLYTASITIGPNCARLELKGIACTNLGVANNDGNADTFGYDELALTSLTWGASNAYSMDLTGKTLLGVYNPPIDTNTNRGVDRKNGITPAADKVWSWNVATDTAISEVVPMVLTMNTKAYDYTVTDPTHTVKVTGLRLQAGDEIHALEQNHIYTLNLNFTEGNITGGNGICIDCTVTIEDWTVVETTPVFGN